MANRRAYRHGRCIEPYCRYKGTAKIFVAEPGEYRLDKVLRGWAAPAGTSLVITPDTRFIATHEAFATWADGRKQLRMEYFYRDLRRQTGILMQDGEPIGGQWNYDADNRKKLPANHIVPKRPRREPDAITKAVIDLVTARFSNHFGELENFAWPVTREEAEADFEYFLDNCLPMFRRLSGRHEIRRGLRLSQPCRGEP